MSAMTVYVLNRTTLATAAEIKRAVAAVRLQVARDFGPIWGIFADVKLLKKGQHLLNSWDAVLVITDNCADVGADAWHSLSRDGRPWGIVAIQPSIDAGEPWSLSLSHETLELLADRFVGFSVNYRRKAYAVEPSDPVQAFRYAYKVLGEWVSAFVTPRWYRLTNKGAFSVPPFCKRPFHIVPGGYLEMQDFREKKAKIRKHDGQELPSKLVKANSRKARRKARA